MQAICDYYHLSRQAHDQMLERQAKRQQADGLILERVRQIRRQHPRLGARKLLVKLGPMLAAEGLQIGRDRFLDLLRSNDLLVQKRKAHRRTTFPGRWRTPNRLPGRTISQPNQVWVSDLTYLETESQPFVYLFLLMDLYSRFIVGWQVSRSLAADGALSALKMALETARPDRHGLIHHSDHGVQYTSSGYLQTLSAAHILPSMGEIGNCYDNVFAERVIGTLKDEYRLNDRLLDFSHATHLAQEAIRLYNTDRPHLALGYAYPQDVYLGLFTSVSPLIIPAS